MTFLILLQQISGIFLVFLVLLHSAKADGIAGIGGQANTYGGGVQQEMEKGLDKITTYTAAIFIALSFLIARQF